MRSNKHSSLPAVSSTVLAMALSAFPQATDKITVPAGTKFKARLETALSSKLSEPGDNVIVALSEPVIIGNGQTLPRGLEMYGKITSAKKAGRVKGKAELFVLINELKTNYGSEAISVSIDAADDAVSDKKIKSDEEGKLKTSELGDDFEKARRGASVGTMATIPAAIAGHRNVGTAVAGPAGGALAGILLSRGKEVRLPVGSILRMKFDKDLVIPASVAQSQPNASSFAPGGGQFPNRPPDLRERRPERPFPANKRLPY